jgi:hypothetical protein
VIAGLWFLFGRGEGQPLGGIIGPSTPPVPTFRSRTALPKYEPLQAHLAKAKLEKAAKARAADDREGDRASSCRPAT